jgi:Uma2 family endonuclease
VSGAIANQERTPVPAGTIRRLSVHEYHRMIDAGILGEDEAVELLEGILVTQTVRRPRHDVAVSLIHAALTGVLPAGWFCRVQSAVTTQDSEPEPDVAVVRGPPRRYASAHPTSDSIALLVEVAEGSLARDRIDKARLYARAGMAVYWIVNLVDQVVETHTNPDPGRSEYAERRVFGAADAVSFEVDGQTVRIQVADVLP